MNTIKRLVSNFLDYLFGVPIARNDEYCGFIKKRKIIIFAAKLQLCAVDEELLKHYALIAIANDDYNKGTRG